MWRKIFSPELLFLIGTFQALSPYILWAIQGLNPNYQYELTYLPIFIWMFGYICFFLGAKIIKNKRLDNHDNSIKIGMTRLKIIITIVLFVVIIQIFQVIRIYGTLPLYGYATGSIDVNTVNELQKESGFGILGMFSINLFFLSGLLLALLIKSIEINQGIKWFFLFASTIEILGNLISGKRQGLFIYIVYILCGLSIRFNRPLTTLLKIVKLPSNKILRLITFISGFMLLVFAVGFISSLRVGIATERSGIDEIMDYLQFPLINLEAQCNEIGLNPYKFNFVYPLISLLPFKLFENFALANSDLPFRPEATIGAGFYGTIHWGLGITGIALYSFLFGLISKYFYQNSFKRLSHLLIYCLISWTLLSAHTYNHFLNLIFLPVPSLLFWLFCQIFNRSSFNLHKL
ncbi:MAG: oligosaccharide repeat unit polymerase [Dolichospermum sp. DEX189]|jgi:oligosaccharide repeat unit polymerase|nr:oligosaccharide repeat unit polymerase [Dolichospermum sp. DEX189]